MSFVEVDEQHISTLLANKDAKETQRIIQRSVKQFRKFLSAKGESESFENLSKTELNERLRLFYVAARKVDGDFLKSKSLSSLKYGVFKYIKDTLDIDINKDCEFSSSNSVFCAVLNDLKKKGLGSVDHKPTISPGDLAKLYDKDNVATNPNTPYGLLHKVWFDIMIFLCRRGRENLREMTRDSFSVGKDASGRCYVYQKKNEKDKNHSACDDPNGTIGEGRMYEQPNNPMCPVASFLKYISKLNPENKAFWQKPKDSFGPNDDVWYTKAPVGKNTLSSMMSTISKKSNLSTIYTNHSIRATAITEMDAAGIDSRHIMRVSGHKSETSLKSYTQRLSENKKREISDCLVDSLMNTKKTKVTKDCASSSTCNMTNVESVHPKAIENVQIISNQPSNDISDLDFLFADGFLQELFNNSTCVNEENILPTNISSENVGNLPLPVPQALQMQENNFNSGIVCSNTNVTPTLPMQFNHVNTVSESTNRNVMPCISNNNCTVNFSFHFR